MSPESSVQKQGGTGRLRGLEDHYSQLLSEDTLLVVAGVKIARTTFEALLAKPDNNKTQETLVICAANIMRATQVPPIQTVVI